MERNARTTIIDMTPAGTTRALPTRSWKLWLNGLVALAAVAAVAVLTIVLIVWLALTLLPIVVSGVLALVLVRAWRRRRVSTTGLLAGRLRA